MSLDNCSSQSWKLRCQIWHGFQKQCAKDYCTANYAVLAIREISFVVLNALDNYYHLSIIGNQRVAVNSPRVILNVE